MHYDVFNGDADGICALLQLRLSQPRESTLISGVKRDIQLLQQVDIENAQSVTVLDISMEKNQPALAQLLANDIEVFYCDHHRSGDIPKSEHLQAIIDLAPETCTSLLINQHLQGQFAHWAIAGAFGDNLLVPAQQLANQCGLSNAQIEFLKELGTLINYNGYGASLADLTFEPTQLFEELLSYSDPLAMMALEESPFTELQAAYKQDSQLVGELKPSFQDNACQVYELPCEAWARRISGVFGNQLANQNAQLAHGVITLNPSGNDYTVSVRAPLNNRIGADDVCCQFATGGGRKAAAGINQLPKAEVSTFIDALSNYYKHLGANHVS
ncbi:acetyltransferase [Paraferrimonas haliotis]|uniref:Acetyltransferase n=1 Tax=Paraferrimonas haliotis TaxID=2013866 RepID=A0AA37TTV8_9GAMM|nr:acetyltransferase [Paraferrimonas haliotis]GLS82854.1 acetyltransferase [Paraferrimonas haliotis]